MTDIQDLKRRLLDNPNDKEALDTLQRAAKRTVREDLEIFCKIFERDSFDYLCYKIQGDIYPYFSEEEWDIIRSNNKIDINHKTWRYGNILSGHHFGFFEQVDPKHLYEISFQWQDLVSFDSNNYPNLRKLNFSECVLPLQERLDLSNPSLKEFSFIRTNKAATKDVRLNLPDTIEDFTYQVKYSYSEENILEFLLTCKNLRTLRVENEKIPEGLLCRNTGGLTRIHLENCGLKDFPDGNFPKLVSLNLDQNQIPNMRGKFPVLRTLEISRNKGRLRITGKFPSLVLMQLHKSKVKDRELFFMKFPRTTILD